MKNNKENSKKHRQSIKMIKASEIKDNYSMREAIDDMEEAFTLLSSGNIIMPQRYVSTFGNENLTALLKPVVVESKKRSSIKILTQKESRIIDGIPTIIGIVLVIDTYTGEIISIMDGEYLTALRTGAASGLATKYFAREDAKTLAIFGCGAQGKSQLKAMTAVREIDKVWVYDTNKMTAQSFTSEMKLKIDIEIEYTENLSNLLECDVICTATNSNSPLFKKEHLKQGVHINAIGSFKPDMQELDPSILLNASIYVDDKKSCFAESGDLIKPITDGVFTASHIRGEIGEYALKKISGRKNKNEITVFKSVGVAIQDFVVASSIYEKSKTDSFGSDIRLFE